MNLGNVVPFLLLLVAGCAALPHPAPPIEVDDPFRSHATDDFQPPPEPVSNPALKDPEGRVAISVGAGKYEVETSDSNSDGATSAGFFRIEGEGVTEAGVGGGLAMEVIASDDTLLNKFVSSDSEGAIADLFLYLLVDPWRSKRGRCAFRVGGTMNGTKLEDSQNVQETTWNSLGLRAEVRPELRLFSRSDFSLDAIGRASGGLHVSSIEFESTTIDDDFDSHGHSLGAELGLRTRYKAVGLTLSYLFRQMNFAESDDKAGFEVPASMSRFQGIVLTFEIEF